MIKYENHCCDCAVPGYPCIGNGCPYVNVPVYYCDACKDDTMAEYNIEDKHYCEEHVKEYLKKIFDSLTTIEQAEVLGVLLKRVED